MIQSWKIFHGDAMTYLTSYQDFVERVDELGFLFLSRALDGFPSLGAETRDAAWHTGDEESDPWRWKDRAAQEKRLAYGCILGGHKGFVSARMYSLFYAACHPPEPMPECWASGIVKQTTWQLWQVFEQKRLLNTSEVRREMGVSASSGASRVDAAMQELQAGYYLTTAGVRRKIAKNGQPFGWPNTVFDRVRDWAPPEWLSEAPGLRRREAWEMILETGLEIANGVDRQALARILGAPARTPDRPR
jgi:hypothetical protein